MDTKEVATPQADFDRIALWLEAQKMEPGDLVFPDEVSRDLGIPLIE